MDRGAWWAAVSGVTQSQTRLKRLGSSSSSSGKKNPPANAGDAGLIPGSGTYPGERNGKPLQPGGLQYMGSQKSLT